ncbi:hypothetical protein ASC77_19550 [Nocardioides sp. Root1257]|nr:hypothetical protein ASC77_19550 [Nocardioides sp. Root1257]KRC46011.1 hypothetical protein ASE24_15670 [Nocardioides sp. Root224]
MSRLGLTTPDLAEVVFETCCNAIADLSGNLLPEDVGSDAIIDLDSDDGGVDDPQRVWVYQHVLSTGAAANESGEAAQLAFILDWYEESDVVIEELERIAKLKDQWNRRHPDGPTYPPGPPFILCVDDVGRTRSYSFPTAPA